MRQKLSVAEALDPLGREARRRRARSRSASSSSSWTVTQSRSGSRPQHLGEELPRPRDRLGLEVVAEAEVAEHLEEREVPVGAADVVEVVVLAAGAHALLHRRRPAAYGGVSSPTKYGLNGTMPATVNSTVWSMRDDARRRHAQCGRARRRSRTTAGAARRRFGAESGHRRRSAGFGDGRRSRRRPGRRGALCAAPPRGRASRSRPSRDRAPARAGAMPPTGRADAARDLVRRVALRGAPQPGGPRVRR